MASTAAHAASASILALTAAGVSPGETGYVVAALVSAAILDIDHVIYVIRDWRMYRREGFAGNLHHARSPFHELFGLLLVGIGTAGLYFFDPTLALIVLLAFTIHLLEDWFLGKTLPFTPLDDTVVRYFSLNQRQKVLIDILILAASGGAWLLYLNGAL
jgi:hypothetical protein